jgi:hypothetical protein
MVSFFDIIIFQSLKIISFLTKTPIKHHLKAKIKSAKNKKISSICPKINIYKMHQNYYRKYYK